MSTSRMMMKMRVLKTISQRKERMLSLRNNKSQRKTKSKENGRVLLTIMAMIMMGQKGNSLREDGSRGKPKKWPIPMSSKLPTNLSGRLKTRNSTTLMTEMEIFNLNCQLPLRITRDKSLIQANRSQEKRKRWVSLLTRSTIRRVRKIQSKTRL